MKQIQTAVDILDVQNKKPEHPIDLNWVGVENLRKYIIVKRPKKIYHNIVSVNTYVHLNRNQKGVHMSRFNEVIESIPTEVSSLESLAKRICRLNIEKQKAQFSFTKVTGEIPYQIPRPNGKPETNIIKVEAGYNTLMGDEEIKFYLYGMSSCPCSYEMCNGRTHNQKSLIECKLTSPVMDIELFDIVRKINKAFSSPIYSCLKRPEEKHVVTTAIENSKFVEDICRDCIYILKNNFGNRSIYANVKVTNDESIHFHKVMATWKGII